ncbi:MAG: response regulator [Deltaproteobacteria bacterium]|jgi:CheY-like chemotaxis protein|nr:response regulator [Deltaproteobacteria bacterium]MBW2531663.1 response regulator [Deltaproteobacteria bacterium]
MVKLGFAKETVRGFIPPGALRGPELQRIVTQALDRIMSPTDRDGTLQTALGNAGQQSLPESAGELTAFVFGPLHDVVEQAFGAEMAERFLYSLTPFLKQACRHEATAGDQADVADEDLLVDSSSPSPSAEAEQEQEPPSSGEPPTRRVPDMAEEPAEAAEPEAATERTLLVVDSEPRSRAQLSHRLRSAGYGVFTAPDGHVALAVCMRNRPDAIIAAAEMPTVGGRQLMALLRVAFANESPPVIMLTEPDGPPPAASDAAALVSRKAHFDDLRRAVEKAIAGAR